MQSRNSSLYFYAYAVDLSPQQRKLTNKKERKERERERERTMAMRSYANNEAADTVPVFIVRQRTPHTNRDCDNIKPSRCVSMQMPPCWPIFFFPLALSQSFSHTDTVTASAIFLQRSRKIDRYRSVTAKCALVAWDRTRKREPDLSSWFYLFSQDSAFLFPFLFYTVMLFI